MEIRRGERERERERESERERERERGKGGKERRKEVLFHVSPKHIQSNPIYEIRVCLLPLSIYLSFSLSLPLL